MIKDLIAEREKEFAEKFVDALIPTGTNAVQSEYEPIKQFNRQSIIATLKWCAEECESYAKYWKGNNLESDFERGANRASLLLASHFLSSARSLEDNLK